MCAEKCYPGIVKDIRHSFTIHGYCVCITVISVILIVRILYEYHKCMKSFSMHYVSIYRKFITLGIEAGTICHIVVQFLAICMGYQRLLLFSCKFSQCKLYGSYRICILFEFIDIVSSYYKYFILRDAQKYISLCIAEFDQYLVSL